MLQRRLRMGHLVKKEYECLTPDGLLETCFIFPQKLSREAVKNLCQSDSSLQLIEKYLFPPEVLKSRETRILDGTVARLSFIPPLSMDEKRILFQSEIVRNTESQLV